LPEILVGTIPDGTVEKPVNFVVDASQAGVGNLEVAVNEGKIPSMAHALGQHKYEITFVPKEPIDHQISVRFNNEVRIYLKLKFIDKNWPFLKKQNQKV
jgi:filamin